MIGDIGWTSLIGALLCPALAALSWRFVRSLPEPEPEPGDPTPTWSKPTYASIASRRKWFVATLVIAAALGLWAGTTDDPWPWFAWGSVGLVLVVVDLASTYLPIRLHWWAAGLTVLPIAVALVREQSWAPFVAVAGGAVVATGFFWLVWRFTGQFGFGDVRLALPLGALAGTLGWSGWFMALFAGTALGAIHGLVVTAWRRRHPSGLGGAFPYGPALWCGPWVALAVAQLSR